MIFHITTLDRWKALSASRHFTPEMYDVEKYIHCCEEHQVDGVLYRYFSGQENLLKLSIDETKLEVELKYEPGTNNEMFPHLYGELNKSTVMKVEPLN